MRAQAAGVFGLEYGLRLASRHDREGALEGIATFAPSLTMVSGRMGRVVEPHEVLDGAYRRRRAAAPDPI